MSLPPNYLMRETVFMSSAAYRGLRLALGVLFVLGAAMVVAPNAHAQAWTSGEACVWPSDVPGLFFGNYNGAPNCEALCKKTASVCRRLVRDGGECWQGNNSGIYAIYEASECKNLEVPADRKLCNEFSNDAQRSIKQSIHDAVNSGIESCNAYQTNCVANCGIIE
jgi:hypothetical protein